MTEFFVPKRPWFLGVCVLSVISLGSPASDLDTIGVTILRNVDATLVGSGIWVAQAEALTANTSPAPFEVNPATVGQSPTLFNYYSDAGSAATFPNAVGAESGHADNVAWNYYGVTAGVAPQVSHVDNYEASYFYYSIISVVPAPSISARIVNQSWIFGSSGMTDVDQNYDNYAAYNGTLFVSGAGNGGQVSAPSTAPNGLSVGVYGASSSVGPTIEGRCKPDLVAPGGATSFSTPYVSGAAAVLLQAANRGDGGTPTYVPGDLRVLKALLINGALKPGDWTNSPAMPLDARYGAGIVNVFNSWKQMGKGRHSYIEASSNPVGNPHPPGSNTNNEPDTIGWDYNSIANTSSSGTYKEQVNHYYLNLDPTLGSSFTFTATLAWNRLSGRTNINNLNLFLYQVGTGNLITSSTSAVNNVEHIFRAALPAGRYDLQVQKSPTGQVSPGETYGLAYEAFSMKLNVSRTSAGVVLSWPVYPAGFHLESTSLLAGSAVWSPVGVAPAFTNSQNFVVLPPTASDQLFRLRRP